MNAFRSFFRFVPRGLITAVLGIEILEVRGAAFALSPSLAVAVILLTNRVLLVEEPLAASKLN